MGHYDGRGRSGCGPSCGSRLNACPTWRIRTLRPDGNNADINCSSGPGLITGYGGHPTACGFGFRAHLRSLAAG